jgi:DNA-binding LacI/PurR family transcriptional regulator
VRTLMQRKAPRPTAVFMYNDLMAAGGLHALRALGLRVPDDIAVVGFDGVALGAFTDPELTTIVHPREALGRLAAQTLFDLLDRVQPSQVTQTLPIHLVVRQSCGADLSHSLRNKASNNRSGHRRGNHAKEHT